MKISVLIPTYNSSAVIQKTLESVFRQSRPPDEVLVLDDGSKDDTVSILKSYQPKLVVLQQLNRGVAAARNELCQRAGGDLLAFLDHDDLWHPRYLEVQGRRAGEHPTATAFFTSHVNFYGLGNHEWREGPVASESECQVIAPASFVERYNNSTGTFYSMSFCCLPKWLLGRLREAPFCEAVSGVDDCYLGNLLPLHGSVVFTPAQLVAYRVTPQAQSVNQLKNFQKVVQVFEMLEPRYQEAGDASLCRAFHLAFAGKRRRYGKTLMGAGRAIRRPPSIPPFRDPIAWRGVNRKIRLPPFPELSACGIAAAVAVQFAAAESAFNHAGLKVLAASSMPTKPL